MNYSTWIDEMRENNHSWTIRGMWTDLTTTGHKSNNSKKKWWQHRHMQQKAKKGAKKLKINWYCNLAPLWGACGTASVCSWKGSPWSRSCTISKNSLRISVLGWKKTHKWTFWLQHPFPSTSSICCWLKVRSISNLAFSSSGYISYCFSPPTNKIVDIEITLVGGEKGHLGRNSVM